MEAVPTALLNRLPWQAARTQEYVREVEGPRFLLNARQVNTPEL